MFRQTFIRGAHKRKLEAGASNDTKHNDRVHCSLAGEEYAVDEMFSKLRKRKPINSWNAQVTALHFYHHFIEISEHQVTTENVNQFQWSPDVTFYL